MPLVDGAGSTILSSGGTGLLSVTGADTFDGPALLPLAGSAYLIQITAWPPQQVAVDLPFGPGLPGIGWAAVLAAAGAVGATYRLGFARRLLRPVAPCEALYLRVPAGTTGYVLAYG